MFKFILQLGYIFKHMILYIFLLLITMIFSDIKILILNASSIQITIIFTLSIIVNSIIWGLMDYAYNHMKNINK